jgi:hypothetical protein
MQFHMLQNEVLEDPEQWKEFQNTLRTSCIYTNGGVRANLFTLLETTARAYCPSASFSSVPPGAVSISSHISSSSSTSSSSEGTTGSNDETNVDQDDHSENRSRTSSSSCVELSASFTPQRQAADRTMTSSSFDSSLLVMEEPTLTDSSVITNTDVQRHAQKELKRRSGNANISPFESSGYDPRLIAALNATKCGYEEPVSLAQRLQRTQRRLSLQLNSVVSDIIVSDESTAKLSMDDIHPPTASPPPANKQRRRNSMFTISFNPPTDEKGADNDDDDNDDTFPSMLPKETRTSPKPRRASLSFVQTLLFEEGK